MSVREEFRQLNKIANTKLHDYRVKEFTKSFMKAVNVDILANITEQYYTMDNFLVLLNKAYNLIIPEDILAETLLFPVTGRASEIRPYSSISMEMLTDNTEGLLAKAVLKLKENKYSLLLNRDVADEYLLLTGFMAIEFCLSLKKYRVSAKNLGNIMLISLDDYNPIVVKTSCIDDYLTVIQQVNQEAGYEVFLNLGKLLRKHSPEINKYIESKRPSDIEGVVKGF